jgi:hypothetical protein
MDPHRFPWERAGGWRPLYLVAVMFAAVGIQNLWARDVFVLLSGGNSPLENNYSQYLQAKAVSVSFLRNYCSNSVWIFFGAGNVDGEPPIFGDVHRQIKRDRMRLDSWMAGALPRNRPARRDVVLRAFREEILPAVVEGGTLYLFVGDHGSRPRGEGAESIINLWSLEPDATSKNGWRSLDNATLGVSELRRILIRGLGRGQVVFCMTQCHSGGFHYLAVPRTMTPNPKWFTVVPDWVDQTDPPEFPRAAGFAATDEFSAAAGCDPAPDLEQWAGYERFVPEKMFGLDMFTLERLAPVLGSFAEAHEAATLVDGTIDNPYSTSEQYLERWADLIESHLADEPNLTKNAKKGVTAYRRAVNGAIPRAWNRAFRARRALFLHFIDTLTEENPLLKKLLVNGTRRDLEKAVALEDSRPSSNPQRPRSPSGRRRRGGAASEMRKLWSETVRPAWAEAVDADRVTNLLGAAHDFEKHLLEEEAEGQDFFTMGGRERMEKEVFWQSGYSNPQTLDPARAEAVARWGLVRRSQILAWAREETDERLRDAAERLSRGRFRSRSLPALEERATPEPEPISRETAAERTLFYRRVLAAWRFLLSMKEDTALARLSELTALERTPLPRPRTQ